MTGYQHHYTTARQELIDWYYKKHDDQTLAGFWFTNCNCIDTMMYHDDELKFVLEAFDEAEQVKIIYDHTKMEHLLKIKWEVNPWWPKQVLHFYYCVLLPIDDVKFVHPYSYATNGARNRALPGDEEE